ncbi:hypothetical protein PR202_gb18547 [Eleusine coracana subsp. coracana]|uniref:Large ribosomal subunit protein uL11m n=1 Tax=Eleusine coracana subsp. coracana TaxID=191504 RepID=A0AAV5F7P0_ELECO|nr:hypothetical protein QOZ80_3BG0294770 [Eleusine coracana subsp. coracana]GJN30256.1 hypothetical protein PR202_gb18547 [Eleusine coracana subsp. coracana]
MAMATLKDAAARKPVLATIRLIVSAGAARPAPPVGPALGFYRLNLMAFCKDFNARTQKYKADTPRQVTLTAYKDTTFEFVVKSPSVSWFLKKAAGIETASGRPGHNMCRLSHFAMCMRLQNLNRLIHFASTCHLRP